MLKIAGGKFLRRLSQQKSTNRLQTAFLESCTIIWVKISKVGFRIRFQENVRKENSDCQAHLLENIKEAWSWESASGGLDVICGRFL